MRITALGIFLRSRDKAHQAGLKIYLSIAGGGIMIGEITQDALDDLSLLSAIDQTLRGR